MLRDAVCPARSRLVPRRGAEIDCFEQSTCIFSGIMIAHKGANGNVLRILLCKHHKTRKF